MGIWICRFRTFETTTSSILRFITSHTWGVFLHTFSLENTPFLSMMNKNYNNPSFCWVRSCCIIHESRRPASAERRRPRRPRFPNSGFPQTDSCFASLNFDYQSRRPWTKTRTSATTLRKGMRASIIQDGEDVDVLRSPGRKNIGE